METTILIASSVALAVAVVAAVYDWWKGEIPNWITLPPLVMAPLAYAVFVGVDYGASSVSSMFLCALVPYVLFRRHGMGGGDVKLFGALGAITGFDIMAGVEIELVSFLVALVFALGALAWKGGPALLTPVRMGGAILLATAFFTVPALWLVWGIS